MVKNLTIYFEEKKGNGDLVNIFLNDKSSANESQSIIAKTGRFEKRGNRKILVLYDGKTINDINGKTSEFEFSKTDFNISNFTTQTVTHQKTQENSSLELINCSLIFNNFKKDINNKIKNRINNCSIGNLENVYKEIYSRLIKPIYVAFLVAISLLLILKSKTDHTFKLYKFKVYSLGFFAIIFLELSSKFITTNLIQNLFLITLPILSVFIMYIFFLKSLKTN